MAVKNGLARRARPRSRPLGVGPKAEWNDKIGPTGAGAWCEGPYWFDEATVDKAAAFFPRFLVFTAGEWAGQPFKLEPWEEADIVRPLFGWKRQDGTRRYRRCFVWLPRKNGKTELAAGVALLVLMGDGEDGGEIYSIASSGDQARIVFDKATAMANKSPSLNATLELLKTSIYHPGLNASIKPLSGKPEGKHGFNASGLIGDEIHEWRSGDLYTFIHDSSASRRQPLEFLISTAGKKGTYGEEVWDECLKIRDGIIQDDETLVVIYAAEQDDDWTNPKIWAKANPNLGKTISIERVTQDCARARHLPRLENAFKQFRLNIWTEQAVRWLPIDAVDDKGHKFGWDHCVGPLGWKDLEERLKHKRCFGGLDLSSTVDLSALIWWFPIQEGLEVPAVLARFWKPGDLIKEHSKRDRLPYDQWVRDGALFETPGNVIDYEFIQRQVYKDAEQFRVAYYGQHDRKQDEGGLAIDRFNATETAVKLQDNGIPVVFFGQGFVSLSAPAKELERLVLSNAFHHGGHPVLRRHAQAVTVETDAADNIKPSKAKSSERIDGIAALCNALGIAGRGAAAKRSVYEDADFVV